jgi:hypothetical protein
MSDILAELAVKITTDTTDLTKGISEVESKCKTLSGKLNQVGKYAGIASAAIVTGFTAAALKFSKTSDAIQEMSQRTGLSTTYIQQLGYAAKLTGSSTEGLETAIKRMQVTITGASESTGEMGAMLKSLQGLGAEEQFEMLADLIAEIEDPTERAAMAVQLFGKSGTDLLPILMEGSAGIEKYKKAAMDANAVIGEDAVNAGARLQDNLDILSASFAGLVVRIGAAVSGDLDNLVGILTNIVTVVGDWAKANPGLIKQIFEIAAAILVMVGVMKAFAIAQAIVTAMSGWAGIAALVVGAAAAALAVMQIENTLNNPELQGYTNIGEGAWYKETPAYASGGIVTSPQLAMVGEAGPEAIIPLSEMGGGNVTVQLIVDGAVFTDVIERRMYDRVNLQR